MSSSQLVDLPHFALTERRIGKLTRLGYNCAEHTYATTTIVRMLAVPHSRAFFGR